MTQQVASQKKAQLPYVSTCVCTIFIFAIKVCDAVTANLGDINKQAESQM